MKTIFKTFIFSVISFFTYAQSVTLEPGKSVFNQNTTESVEINSTSAFPLSLRSSQPAAGLAFYSGTTTFRGHIQGGVGGLLFNVPENNGFSFWTNNSQRMAINADGKVGIGTATPKYILDVVGNSNSFPDTLASFKYNFNTPISSYNFSIAVGDNGSIFSSSSFFPSNSDFGLRSSNRLLMRFESAFQVNSPTQAVLRVDGNNKVTINPQLILGSTYVPALADLDVNTTIRSAELDFAESSDSDRRIVFADKDGILRVENSTNHYASYNFTAVQAQDYDDQLRKGSGFAWFNTTNIGATMYLPVNLPEGVKVTNIRMFLLDNSASNLSFTFNKNSHLTNTFTAVSTAQSSTNTTNIFSINSNANEIIDNQNNSYYVNISSVGNWTSNTLQFHSLIITYQY